MQEERLICFSGGEYMNQGGIELSNTMTIFLIHDYESSHRGLRSILSREHDIEFVGEATDESEAVAEVASLQPDVALLDYCWQHWSAGIEVSKAIRLLAANTKILVLSACNDDAYLASLARLGINGYLLKSSTPHDLLAALRVVAGNGLAYDPRVSDQVKALLAHRCDDQRGVHQSKALTNRETHVLEHVGLGLTNRDIAGAIGTSVRTVESHIQNLLRKLGATNRTQAVKIAHEIGLLATSPRMF
jgi:DNA-binding NarL/FixJ family response regulator